MVISSVGPKKKLCADREMKNQTAGRRKINQTERKTKKIESRHKEPIIFAHASLLSVRLTHGLRRHSKSHLIFLED